MGLCLGTYTVAAWGPPATLPPCPDAVGWKRLSEYVANGTYYSIAYPTMLQVRRTDDVGPR